MENKAKSFLENEDFSIVLGGPFFQLLRRAKLSGSALEQSKRRVLVLSLIAWLPLLIFTVLSGKASGSTTVPFIEDFSVHIRYLVAVPLMVLAELLVHQRMRLAVKQFTDRNLIPDNMMEKFNAAITSALKMRNSLFAESAILVFVYVIGIQFIWRPYALLETSAWYTDAGAEGNVLNLAGYWFGYVSTPLFQFLVLRWYYRIFIWSRFLWQVSRIQLNIHPLHPDKVGGLGFLSEIDSAFIPLALMHGAFLAGMVANQIFHAGAILTDFKFEIIAVLLLVLVILLLPLLLFTGQLLQAKRKGVMTYGKLGSQYVQDFENKWLDNKVPENEALIGSADIQSLADLANSYEIVGQMQFSPITKQTIIKLTAMTLIPVLPLALTMMPLEELAKKLMGILL